MDFNKLLDLESSLGKSPYFSRVEVVPDKAHPLPDNQLPIVVTLTTAKPEKYTFGLGYGTDNGPHARAIAELRRLNRDGHRAELDCTISKIEQSAALQYVMPWPYPRTDVLTAAAGYKGTRTFTSTEQTGYTGLTFARLWAGWQQSIALNYRREKWQVGVDSALASYLVPEATWSRLRTNDPLDPSDGSRLRFTGSTAQHALLSSQTFERLDAEARWLKTYARKNQLLAHLEAGYTWTPDFRQLPPSARFFAGGAQNVRGFGYNSLGARDEAGHVIGGEAMALASLEYVYRFNKAWGVATFYDIGNAYHRFGDPLAAGTGAGVRWLSPVGMVRLDLGIPVQGGYSHAMQVHLSIGPEL